MRSILLTGLLLLFTRTAVAAEVDERLRFLESREAIRALLIAYGRTLDARDFDGFAKLFARDAEYIGGGAMGSIRGADAIGAALRAVFAANPSGVFGANAHLFFNESIELAGSSAIAVSMGAFVITNEAGQPTLLMLATYHDRFIVEDGVWKFHRREVRSNIPAPAAAPAAR